MASTTQKYSPVPVPTAPFGTEMDDAVVATAVNPDSVEAQPFLEVIAPATLPEGYTFDAVANGQSFAVRVPVGGVEEGQRFSVPLPASAASSIDASGAAVPRPPVPTGRWKDDLCDCFRHGVCHPALCHAIWCPLALLGQVMRRLRLNVCGSEVAHAQAASTFLILLGASIAYAVFEFAFSLLQATHLDVDGNGNVIKGEGYNRLYALHRAFSLFYAIFSYIIVAKTRKRIRAKYDIRETTCHGCEDCCCAFWCQCCAVAQMARHTADYDTYAANCCSETGLPALAPEII